MAEYTGVHVLGRLAETTVTQKRFVKAGTNPQTQCVPATANDVCLGVARGEKGVDTPVDHPVDIGVNGIYEVEAGAAVSVNDYVESDADGRAIVAAGAGAHDIVGIARTAAGAAGDLIEVEVRPSNITI